MTFILIVGLVLFAAAVTLLLRGASQAESSDAIQQIGAYGFSGRLVEIESQEEGSSARRSLDRIANSFGGFANRRLGALREQELRKRLIGAGMYSTTPRKLVGYQLLFACSFPILWFWIGSLIGGRAVFLVVGAVIFAAIGWLGPSAFVDRQTRMRHDRIDYELPELIDILVVTVEAGVGFTGSLRVAAGKMRGPLGQELRLTLQEQNMGLSTTDALVNMLTRADTPGMRSFVRSITQGEKLGVSIGQIMRNLAIEMRKQRRAKAEETAQKAPIKMLFPLIFLIFPAMFVVLLVPAIIKISEALGGN